MQNPFIKNCRTGLHDDLLNRTCHYSKLLTTKSTIDNKHDHNYKSLQRNKNLNSDEQRANSNLKLMKTIFEIDRKYTRYRTQSLEEESKKRTLKSTYLERQKSLEISEDNIRLYRKIKNVQSDLSNNKLKSQHTQNTLYSKLNKKPYRLIFQIDNQFYSTYRQLQTASHQDKFAEALNNSLGKQEFIKSTKKRYKKLNKLRLKTDNSARLVTEHQDNSIAPV